MPGKGKVVRRKGGNPSGSEGVSSAASFEGQGGGTLPTGRVSAFEDRLDIYLNDVAYWRNVPEAVWNYYIGGYQVIKKWLSYREFTLLDRPLTTSEVEEVTNMTRRIAALILMESELNENYQRVKENTYDWEKTP